MEVFRGRQDCAPPPVNVPIEELIPHEQYNPNDRNQYHDIALLRLKLDVEYTGNGFLKLPTFFISRAGSKGMVWFVNHTKFCTSWLETQSKLYLYKSHTSFHSI